MKKILKPVVIVITLLLFAGGVFYFQSMHVTLVEIAPSTIISETSADGELVVTTENGKVQGYQHDKGFIRFASIPFAAPPIDELRFQPPQAVEPWSGVLDSREAGPSCLQKTTLLSDDPALRYQSEDCLGLVLSTPKLDEKKRPVIVWVHGGGLTVGGANEATTDGANFTARGDVVFVSLQYRLGTLGWLDVAHLGGKEVEHSAFNGQLDVVAGLEWVHNNIERFGGDSNNVTVMGESAGAFLIASLLMRPEADEFYNKLILQSGVIEVWELPVDRRNFSDTLMDEMNLKTLADLQALDLIAMREFESNSYKVASARGFPDPMPWYGHRGITADHIAEAAAKNKPILHGTLQNEYHLFLIGYDGDDKTQQLTDAILGALDIDRGQVSELVERVKPYLPHRSDTDLAVDVVSAIFMHYPHSIVSERYGASVPVYTYLIDYVASEIPEWGAFHALDLPIVFGTLDTWSFAFGDQLPHQLSDDMQDAWIAFARTGNPNHGNIPVWPAYDQRDRSTLVFGDNTHLAKDPLAWVRPLAQVVDSMVEKIE